MAHNIVYHDSATNSIIKMSTADVDALANYILEYMVGLGDGATGHLHASSISGDANIGTFTDYYRISGSSDTTLYSDTFTIYQNQSEKQLTYSPNMVGLDTGTPSTTILQSNLMTQANLADEIIARMNGGTYGGIGSYWFSITAPSDGGTWVSQVTVTDKISSTTTDGNCYLWRKVDNGSTTSLSKRPIKLSSGNLTNLTTAEVQQILGYVEQRMVATSKGFYTISDTTPSPGTWVQCGNAIADSTLAVESATYQGTTGDTYTGTAADTVYYTGVQDTIFTSPNQYFAGVTPDAQYFSGTAGFVGPAGPGYAGIVPDTVSFNTYIPYTGTSVRRLTATLKYTGERAFGGLVWYLGPTRWNIYFSVQGTFIGPVSYLGPSPTNFMGPGIEYTGLSDVNYLGSGDVEYTGLMPADYTGSVVSPSTTEFTTSTYPTKYLWRRVA